MNENSDLLSYTTLMIFKIQDREVFLLMKQTIQMIKKYFLIRVRQKNTIYITESKVIL